MSLLFLFLATITAFYNAPLSAETAFTIEVEPLSQTSGYRILGANTLDIPIWIAIDFPRLENLRADQQLPYRGPLPAGAENVPVMTLTTIDPTRSYAYRIVYTHALGDPTAVQHDNDYLYLLPFAHGEKYHLSQGFNGKFSHQNENQYAVDFVMDQGTRIYSAREGVVVDIKEDSAIGGPSLQYRDYGNYLVIQHDDNSFGNYVHLQKNGALVERGARVDAGSVIALSGNTGVSSGPHLHFDVRVPTYEGKMQSIPFLIQHYQGRGVPEEGRYYAALHPGKPLIPLVFGRDLRNEDYQGFLESVPLSNKLNITDTRVDDTTILFVENGFERPLSMRITLNTAGVASSITFPHTLDMPPLTKRFLTILQPLKNATRIRYSSRIEILNTR